MTFGIGAMRTLYAIFEEGSFTSDFISTRARTMMAMRTIGQNNSQIDAPKVLFHTIQFFFMRAEKCLAFYSIVEARVQFLVCC